MNQVAIPREVLEVPKSHTVIGMAAGVPGDWHWNSANSALEFSKVAPRSRAVYLYACAWPRRCLKNDGDVEEKRWIGIDVNSPGVR